MINSLQKDSHITHAYRRSKTSRQEGSVCRNLSQNAPAKSNERIIVRKPAEINFSGLSSAKLANTTSFKSLIEKGRDLLGKEISYKDLSKFIKSAFNTAEAKDFKTEEFIKDNEKLIKSIKDEAKQFINQEHIREPLSGKDLDNELNKTLNTAVEAYPATEKPRWIYNNNFMKKFFNMAANSHSVFSATFAILLTCLLRPAAIMALPGGEKNKDNKKYAAAQSIASGIIGYLMSLVIFSPIAGAISKIEKHPNYFISKNPKLSYLHDPKIFKAAKVILNMSPDALLAVPRATVTIALIPPILKHVFGWEKKSSSTLAPINYGVLNYNNSNNTTRLQSIKEENR